MGELDLLIQQALDNTGGTLTGRQGVFIETQSLINRTGKVIASMGNVTLNSQSLAGEEGVILSANTLNIQGGNLSLNQAITQADQILMTVNTLDHQGGKLLQTGDNAGEITLQGQLNNQAGEIGSNGDFTIKADALNNLEGQILTANVDHLFLDLKNVLEITANQLDIEACAKFAELFKTFNQHLEAAKVQGLNWQQAVYFIKENDSEYEATLDVDEQPSLAL